MQAGSAAWGVRYSFEQHWGIAIMSRATTRRRQHMIYVLCHSYMRQWLPGEYAGIRRQAEAAVPLEQVGRKRRGEPAPTVIVPVPVRAGVVKTLRPMRRREL